MRLKLFLLLALIAKLTQSSPKFEIVFVKFNSEEFATAEMKTCEMEFASSSIAFSVQIMNELELKLFSLEFNLFPPEFNYLRTTSLELNSVKRVRLS